MTGGEVPSLEMAGAIPDRTIQVDRAVTIADHTQPWVRFMAVMGWISAGLMMVSGVFLGILGLMNQEFGTLALLFVYPPLAVLYGAVSLFLFRFGNRLREFARSGDQATFEAALEAQRLFWKVVGVTTMVSIVLMIVFVIVAIVVGVAAALAGGG